MTLLLLDTTFLIDAERSDAQLDQAIDDADGVAIAAAGGVDHPASALWPVALRPALRAFLASGVKPRVVDFAGLHNASRANFDGDAAFMNVNTPDDLAAAAAALAAGMERPV